jgi:Xaa-Pro aminopeptidase
MIKNSIDSFFSSQFFAANRQKLRQLFTGTAPIVITANGLTQRGGDTTFDFSQDASFWYLTGIDEPDITLVMDKEREYLIVPSRSASRETFDGSVDDQELIDRSGIMEIYNDKDGWDKLSARIKKVNHIATLASPGSYIDAYGFYTNPARAALQTKLKSYNSDIELLDLSYHILSLRVIKQPEELKAMVAAINITNASIKEILRPAKLKTYVREYQLEAELSRGFRRRGAEGHGFAPIVASGERACTLHNVQNNGHIGPKDLIVIDTGAEVEHYSADITRTISATGNPSKRQQAVHAAVLDVQEYAFSIIKPGVLLKDYEQQIENYLGEKLRELNLIKIIDHQNVRQYYPHATSHYLGLNVHDIGDYSQPLAPGMVITVEPGIYIKEEAIGVRIEDDVLITKSGIKPLSTKLGRGLNLN